MEENLRIRRKILGILAALALLSFSATYVLVSLLANGFGEELRIPAMVMLLTTGLLAISAVLATILRINSQEKH